MTKSGHQTGDHPYRFDKTGVVVEIKQNDAYLIKMDGSGRVTMRNRKFLAGRKPQLYT